MSNFQQDMPVCILLDTFLFLARIIWAWKSFFFVFFLEIEHLWSVLNFKLKRLNTEWEHSPPPLFFCSIHLAAVTLNLSRLHISARMDNLFAEQLDTDTHTHTRAHTHTHTPSHKFLLWNVLHNLISSLWIFKRAFFFLRNSRQNERGLISVPQAGKRGSKRLRYYSFYPIRQHI